MTTTGTTSGPDPTSEATLGALVHQLSEQIPQLVRSEVRLAQAELTEKGKSAGLGIGMFSAAGLLSLYGLAFLLATVAIVLALFLPWWLATLIVAVVLFTGAALAGLIGKKKVGQAGPPKPERALDGVKEDIATIKGGHQ